ncbi:MAG TPA: hypothetical protein PKI05_04985 [Thermogutta sp.]|nr:hypothetical protein [Thermogutta sp.]
MRKKRSAWGRFWAVTRLEGVSRSDKRKILSILNEYVRQLGDGEADRPEELSYLERGLIAQSASSYAQLEEARARIDEGVRQLVQNQQAFAAREAELAAAKEVPIDDLPTPELDVAEASVNEVKSRVGDLLRLRESLSGRQALGRMMNPRLRDAITIVLFVLQFLLYLKPIVDAIIGGQYSSVWTAIADGLLGAAISASAPLVVLTTSVALGRVLSAKRIEDDIQRLGLVERVLPLNVPSAADGAMQKVVEWLQGRVQTSWAGLSLIAAMALVMMSLLLGFATRFGLNFLVAAPEGGLEGPLSLVSVLLVIFPIGVLVAHVAGSNELADAVAAAERELDEAETRLRAEVKQAATERAMKKAALVGAHRALLYAGEQRRAAAGTLEKLVSDLDAIAPLVEHQLIGGAVRLISIERGVNDRLPLNYVEEVDGKAIAEGIASVLSSIGEEISALKRQGQTALDAWPVPKAPTDPAQGAEPGAGS